VSMGMSREAGSCVLRVPAQHCVLLCHLCLAVVRRPVKGLCFFCMYAACRSNVTCSAFVLHLGVVIQHTLWHQAALSGLQGKGMSYA
jgi:hypothetical protein